MKQADSAALTWGLAALALAVFSPLFITGGVGAFDFWWWMAANAALMTGLSFGLDPDYRRLATADLRAGLAWKIGLGLASAALLYGLFWIGNQAARCLFDFAAGGIDAVYGLKAGASVWRVGLLIGLLIGPAEEVFWRGFLQRRLATRHGRWLGLVLATSLYTGMHIGSGNLMLIAAAGVCGLFWGLMWLRFESLGLNIVSHIVWDLAVFLIFPFS